MVAATAPDSSLLFIVHLSYFLELLPNLSGFLLFILQNTSVKINKLKVKNDFVTIHAQNEGGI